MTVLARLKDAANADIGVPANPLAIKDPSVGGEWSYAAAAAGIVNSTAAVTLKAAAGAGVRNYCKSLQLAWDTLGGATEVLIRDGAGGTVLWRGKLQTAAGFWTINFDVPLKGTANTLLELALGTGVTGGVYANAQGYSA